MIMFSNRRLRILSSTVIVSAMAVLVAASILRSYVGKPRQWEQVTITTATKGGTYHVLGEQFAAILNTLSGRPIKNVVAVNSQGSKHNIDRVVNETGARKLLARLCCNFGGQRLVT